MTAKQEKELMYNFKLAWATERSRPGKKKTAQSCRDDNFSVHVMNVATPPPPNTWSCLTFLGGKHKVQRNGQTILTLTP